MPTDSRQRIQSRVASCCLIAVRHACRWEKKYKCPTYTIYDIRYTICTQVTQVRGSDVSSGSRCDYALLIINTIVAIVSTVQEVSDYQTTAARMSFAALLIGHHRCMISYQRPVRSHLPGERVNA